MPTKKTFLNTAEAKAKLMHYCAYQERCHKEVRSKLLDLGIYHEQLEEVMSFLIEEDFLNEERYAQAFAGGKFRQKQWGRIKILRAFEQRDISAYCIKKGMAEIEEDQYQDTMNTLIQKKFESTTEDDIFVKRRKVAEAIIRKGYEPDLVWKELKSEY